jgi:hypothetical protein
MSHEAVTNGMASNLDGQIESATDSAEARVREHLPWLSQLLPISQLFLTWELELVITAGISWTKVNNR